MGFSLLFVGVVPAASGESENLAGTSQGEAQTLPLDTPLPGPNGWGVDDERGNGNTQGYARACDARRSWPIRQRGCTSWAGS